jgi:hypothetical protein
MQELLGIIRATDSLTTDLTASIKALDQVVARFDRDPDDTSKPLEISDLTEAAIEISAAAEKLTLLLEKATTSLEAPVWDASFSQVDRIASEVMDHAFLRLLVLIAAVFAGIFLLRVVPPLRR